MSIVSKAKTAIGQEVKFDINSSYPFSETSPEVNCIGFVCWAAELPIEEYIYPRIDSMIKSLTHVSTPAPNNIIAYSSIPAGPKSWQKFAPGCAAIISEVVSNKITKIIIAHPKVDGIIGETDMTLFKDKPFIYLEA